MVRGFTQQEFSLLESRRKRLGILLSLLSILVPIEVGFLTIVFIGLLGFTLLAGFAAAALLSSTTLVPLFYLLPLRRCLERDLQEQVANELEGVVTKARYGGQFQFAFVVLNGERYRVPHELAPRFQENSIVRFRYAENSRMVLSVNP